MDTGEPAMDDPNTVGDVAGGKKKKKRNPSFRQHLRKMGLPVSDDCVDEDSGDDSDEDCDGWETDEDDSEEERTHQGEPLADDAKEIQVQEHQFQETLVEERQAEELQLQELQLQEHPLQEIQVEEHQVQQYEEEDSEEYLPYGRYDDPYPSYELQESYNHDYQPGEERPTRIPWHTSFRDYYAQRDQERRAREEATPTTDWNPADPLGLFDELEGPLDWSSQGLFD
ncbi:hypothetical protein N7541_002929 [Penicillium brevicompactum]|uniref:Uncharacterized protein n=1 Tax=Penicillium brevicompactum TaxID=5074 RepID=A0A9W9RM65_PENBR|nr:hypothetical protein N7541_002929 [Penicillium brevicompactum]